MQGLAAALHELSLSGQTSALASLLETLRYCLPRLKRLRLDAAPSDVFPFVPLVGPPGFNGPPAFTAGVVNGMYGLQELELPRWPGASLVGAEHVLLGLTSLTVGPEVANVEISAPLTSLQRLCVSGCHSLRIVGERLSLTNLSELRLSNVHDAYLDFRGMSALQHLAVWGSIRLQETALTSLSCLSSLSVAYDNEPARAVASNLLSAAPTTLRTLHDLGSGSLAPPSLGGMTRLIRIISKRASIIPHLAPLPQLQELGFHDLSATDLAAEHCDVLAELSSLTKLILNKPLPEGDARRRRLKVLKGILPKGCIIRQP
ncbi:hypothetical protein N2152v2_002333 [Parachlorella kessleri]